MVIQARDAKWGSSPLARGLHRIRSFVQEHGGIIPARAGFTHEHHRRPRAHGDHPRSRGVYIRPPRPTWSPPGSSPLARGLLRHRRARRGHRRIIPARAGFTAEPGARVRARRDHPRSRGVYSRNLIMIRSFQGSSPLARGLPASRPSQRLLRRIIPARAGFTRMRGGRLPRPRDHPRSRGVYDSYTDAANRAGGSSPLARGLRRVRADRRPVRRIIPARAGFTSDPTTAHRRAWDHPRSRGVYWEADDRLTAPHGSSPLARGLPEGMTSAGMDAGIIPARAGFTRPPGESNPGPRDHPRSRGVYRCTADPRGRGAGSSPLARGLREKSPTKGGFGGIIPARAGFTAPRRGRRRWPRDHPRSRGVYHRVSPLAGQVVGSSPLARGLRRPRWCGPASRSDHPRSRGVYQGSRPPSCCPWGSSPLARGLPFDERTRIWMRGIIPARAGFTPVPITHGALPTDHPRSRGVYAVTTPGGYTVGGSSPLARGLLGAQDGAAGAVGIIPARAGFTVRTRERHRRTRDHPRSRGVYGRAVGGAYAPQGSSPLARGLLGASKTSYSGAGSSPLARGLLAMDASQDVPAGIIPARAGFTRHRRIHGVDR